MSLPLPPEILRCIALVSHPQTTRTIKQTNSIISTIISKHVLVTAEMNWRLERKDRLNCLLWAARNGHTDVISRLLLNATRPPAQCPTEEDIALGEAASRGHDNIVKQLLAAGANVHSKTSIKYSSYNKYNVPFPPLLHAAESGHADVVSTLLAAGADPDWKCGVPIHQAAKFNHHNVLSLLIDSGANLKHGYVSVALDNAVENNRLPIVKLLVAAGVGTLGLGDEMGCAVKAGHVEMVSFLLAAGTDMEKLDDCDFHVAVCNGAEEIVRMLLDAGKKPLKLHVRTAIRCGHIDMAVRMIEDGWECIVGEQLLRGDVSGQLHRVLDELEGSEDELDGEGEREDN